MIINSTNVPQDEILLHKFMRVKSLSETYPEHLLHNIWNASHNTFMTFTNDRAQHVSHRLPKRTAFRSIH